MRQRWLLIILGPALVFLLGSVLALLFLPHPIPKTATRAQRLYLSHCAECHGANGHGSWRATIFLIRPGDLGDPRTLAGKSDEYLFDLIKNGGAAIGKPGMPSFGFHLTDEEIRELIRHVRNSEAVEAALDRLAKEAADPEVNLMPALIDAVSTYATLGEVMAALGNVFGRHVEVPTI